MVTPIKPQNVSVTQRPSVRDETIRNKAKMDELPGQDKIADQVTIRRDKTEPLTYTDTASIKGGEGAKFELLRKLVVSMLKEQQVASSIVVGDREVDISKISREEAAELVSEDGYFGVEQTSERIFQFAVNISGNDPSRIDAIKEGVMHGFDEALKAFGGELPEISYRTLDAVMQKLDNWVAETSV